MSKFTQLIDIGNLCCHENHVKNSSTMSYILKLMNTYIKYLQVYDTDSNQESYHSSEDYPKNIKMPYEIVYTLNNGDHQKILFDCSVGKYERFTAPLFVNRCTYKKYNISGDMPFVFVFQDSDDNKGGVTMNHVILNDDCQYVSHSFGSSEEDKEHEKYFVTLLDKWNKLPNFFKQNKNKEKILNFEKLNELKNSLKKELNDLSLHNEQIYDLVKTSYGDIEKFLNKIKENKNDDFEYNKLKEDEYSSFLEFVLKHMKLDQQIRYILSIITSLHVPSGK